MSRNNIVLILAILLMKFFFIFLTLNKNISYWIYILVFNLGINILSYFILRKQLKVKLRFIIFVLLIDFLIPFLGTFFIFSSFISFLALRPFYKKSKNTENLDELSKHQFEELIHKNKLDNQLKVKSNFFNNRINFNTLSYSDIIDFGSLQHKILAIEKLSQIVSPNSIHVLKEATKDSKYEIRFMAMNALERIENQLFRDIEIASDAILYNPRDAKTYTFRATLYLGLEYLKIFNEKQTNYFLQLAYQDLTNALALEENPETFLKMALTYIKLRKYSEGLTFINSCLEKKMSETKKYKLLFYKAECFYGLKEFSNVSKTVNLINSKRISFPIIKEGLETWGRENVQ